MSRQSIKIGPFTLGAGGENQALESARAIRLGPEGLLSIHCVVDGGSEGQAPTDAPLGSWRLYCAGDERAPYARIRSAESGPESLASIAPKGNVLVSEYAIFEGAPGVAAKVLYVRTSGGATARATLYVTVS
jgi:hypothetical protein